MSYTFDLQWVNGKNNVIADALSRTPVFSPTQEDHCCCKAMSPTTITAELQPFLDAAQLDKDYESIVHALLTDTDPKYLHPSHSARSYANIWNHLSILSDNPNAILSYNDRIIVPKALRPDILWKLHLSHSGQVKTKKAAQQCYCWPGMNNDIAQMVQQCAVCAEHLPSQKVLCATSPSPRT